MSIFCTRARSDRTSGLLESASSVCDATVVRKDTFAAVMSTSGSAEPAAHTEDNIAVLVGPNRQVPT